MNCCSPVTDGRNWVIVRRPTNADHGLYPSTAPPETTFTGTITYFTPTQPYPPERLAVFSDRGSTPANVGTHSFSVKFSVSQRLQLFARFADCIQ